ncbi:MAG: FAD-dependent oxidoreductase [Methylovirgula sp.]|nr:FAD-dependent oxidoreductase [Methylovirgula sp.]
MAQNIATSCVIAGGGPAGMMAGLLLAHAGVDTIVLEKHADFLRDFRGDTIHPSTLQAMDDLGLYDQFLALPHQKATSLSAQFGAVSIPLADFSHLPTRAKFIAFMPQWDFLNFVAREAQKYPNFRLIMQADVDDLIIENDVVRGVKARTPKGLLVVRAPLTIGADGRHSIVREKAGFTPQDIGAPMDVLWFKLTRRASDTSEPFGRVAAGTLLVMINRGDHWQCGYVIPKGGFAALRTQDIAILRANVARLAPFMADRVAELMDWNSVSLLTVTVNRLALWHRPGLLCIGDSAHAMSPVGGVGINLAIQDAIAAANILAPTLARKEAPSDALLAEVQHRREPAVKLTQAMQVFIQKQVISNVLAAQDRPLTPPWPLRLFQYVPWLRRIPARLIGLGYRRERVRT